MVKRLNWDSEFFGYPVGSLLLDTDQLDVESLEKVLAKERESYQLIYITLLDESKLPTALCCEFGIQLVDTKVLYEKDLRKTNYSKEPLLAIQQVSLKAYQSLESLALQSGIYSRYALDPNFKNNEYECLYREWLRNSLNGSIADVCLAYFHQEMPVGLVTLKEKVCSSDIGILAVDLDSRGLRIGSALLYSAERASSDWGREWITVATQMANIGACRFYEANNYTIGQMWKIYHLWNEHYNPL